MKSKNGITLSVSHLIHLTKEERYTLANGGNVKTMGVSVPVWYWRGKTSEPANEVFSTYELIQDGDNDFIVSQKDDRYIFNIKEPIETKNDIISYESLKDIKDGGSTCLNYTQYFPTNIQGLSIQVLHVVRIASIEELEGSFINNLSEIDPTLN